MESRGLRELCFKEAVQVFIELRRPFISKWQQKDDLKYAKALGAWFGELRLDEIHIGHIRAYQKERQKAGTKVVNNRVRQTGAGPGKVNQECSFLIMLLKEAGVWRGADQYKPLPMPRRRRSGRALTEEEESRLFLVASTRKRWRVAYCCALLSANTTAGPGEILNLRICDVNLRDRLIHIVEGTKNEEGRVREIPLNDAALWAATELVTRYQKLMRKWRIEIDPSHYLLPHRACQNGCPPDPCVPMYSFNKAWANLRRAAGLAHIRYYDIRHHAITRLLENPNVSEQTIEDLAGHLTHEMKRRYSHIRRKAREDATKAISSKFFAANA